MHLSFIAMIAEAAALLESSRDNLDLEQADQEALSTKLIEAELLIESVIRSAVND